MSLGISPSIFSGDATDHDALVFGDGGAQTGFFFLDLPTGVYFDSIRLENPEPFWEDRSPIVNTVELESGEVAVQSSPSTFDRPLRVSYRCQTTIHGNISLLLAKIGAPYTLKIDEFVYENCHIRSFREKEWFPGEFEYIISFVQDTS